MNRRKRIRVAAGLGLFALVLWFALPVLLPELALTQRPREFAEVVPITPAPVSHVTLPIELPLKVLEQRLTAELDASLARDRDDSDFKAWRSGALRLQAQGNSIRLSMPLSFKSSSGPDTKGSLIVNTRIAADITPEWLPKVSVRSSFDWTKKPNVKLLFFKVRVSGVVGRSISKKLGELDTDIKQRIVTALTLKPRAEKWWQGLYQPDLLTEEPPVWLSVDPQSFYFEPLGGDNSHLRLTLGIRARLSTAFAREPAPVPPMPLPPLQRATAEDEGFALHFPVLADYQGLAVEMREELAGREIRLERGAITPTDFTLYTSGRNLVVGIDFISDAPGFWMDTRGTVYFTGEPRFDPETKILRIENFRFTRRLNNPLLSTATWVLQDSLREQMQERLTWNLGERLQEGAQKLSVQLNQPLGDDLRLSGEVQHLNLTGIECLAQGIQIGLEVRGQLKVSPAEPKT